MSIDKIPYQVLKVIVTPSNVNIILFVGMQGCLQ